MGNSLSPEQLTEYREVVKGRLSDEGIAFLHGKFLSAAADGLMTPDLFKKYVDHVGIYKESKLRVLQQGSRHNEENAKEGAETLRGADRYDHLFRGYDLDGDGVITFKEFLIYHLAIVYDTEELFYIIFSAYDADGDGYLSYEDVRSVITAATRYVGDCDVHDQSVRAVIDAEARRLMGFLDIRRQGKVHREDMQLITRKFPEILDKMKYLM